jgi:four helix bundle protein
VGANRAEAKSAYSNKDFASKNAICLKEAREALFWLRVAQAKALGNVHRRNALMKDANELVSIFVTVVRTLQEKNGSR